MIDRNNIVKLSYDMEEGAPVPEGIPGAKLNPYFTIEGNGGNVFEVSFSTHTGSHVDAPNHMLQNGRKITEYSPADFVFDNPFCIETALEADGLLLPGHLEKYGPEIGKCDFLMIVTGWSRKRLTDPSEYALHCPGLSVPAAQFLSRFGNIRAIGADLLSYAAPAHVKEGVEAHKILMRNLPAIQLYEDLNLDSNAKKIKQIICAPWIVKGADSAPCTLIGLLG